MTKQQWESEANEYQAKIDAEYDKENPDENMIDYWNAAKSSCYASAASAVDEQDLSAEELHVFRH